MFRLFRDHFDIAKIKHRNHVGYFVQWNYLKIAKITPKLSNIKFIDLHYRVCISLFIH